MAGSDPYGFNGPSKSGGASTPTAKTPATKAPSDPYGFSGSSSSSKSGSSKPVKTGSPTIAPKKQSLFGSIVHAAAAPLRLGKRAAVDAEHLATGVPRAIVGTAEAAAELPKAAYESVAVSLKHGHIPFTRYTPAQSQAIHQELAKDVPHVYGVVAGQAQTLRDVGAGRALDPGFRRQVTQDPLKLYSQHPLSALVNDAANLAPVVGGIAHVTAPLAEEAGAAGSAASGIQRAAAGVNRVAAAPIEAYKLPFKLPGRIGQAAADSLTQAAAVGEHAFPGARVLARLSPASQSVINELSRMHAEEAVGRIAPQKLEEHLTQIMPDPHEQQAASIVGEGVAKPLAVLREQIGQEHFDNYVNQRFKGSLTPEAANLAADVASGKNPGLAERIAQVHQMQQSASLEQGGQVARSEAFQSQPGHEWQGGFAPHEGAVAEAVKPLQLKLTRAERDAAVTGQRASNAASDLEFAKAEARIKQGAAVPPGAVGPPDLRSSEAIGRLTDKAQQAARQAQVMENNRARLASAIERKSANAAQDITNQPARLRPALVEARAAQHQLVGLANDLRGRGLHDQAALVEQAMGQLPTTSAQAEAQGLDPLHQFHTQEPVGKRSIFKRSELPKANQQASSEKLRTGSPVYDRSFAGQTRGTAEVNAINAKNAAAERIGNSPAAARLGEGPLAGANTAEEAKSLGYRPMPGFDKAGKLTELDTKLGLSKDTPFIPDYLYKEFASAFGEGSKATDVARVIGLPNRAFYAARLALSPALITGRLLGHAMLGFSQTSNPIKLAENIGRVVKYWKRTGEFPAPAQVVKGEAYTAERAGLESEAADLGRFGKVRGAMGKVAGAQNKLLRQPFRLAGFMDNVERSAFYMTELGKNLSKAAADEGTHLGGISKAGRDAAAEQALTTALRAMGDFNRMSPFEQNVVRQFIPMYRWHKELTRIAFHLAEDHPLRLAWTLHLADMLGKPDATPPGATDTVLPLDPNAKGTPSQSGANDRFRVGTYPDTLPQYWSNALPVGNHLLGTGLLNPFAETTDLLGGGLGGAGKFLGPTPRLAVTNLLTHTNPTTGKDYFRPPGTGTVQGHPAPPALWRQLWAMAPQSRLLSSLTGNDQIVRYASGEPYLPGAKGGEVPQTVPTGSTPLQGLSSFAGVSVGNRRLIEAQQAKKTATAAKAKTTTARQVENYRRKVKAAKTGTKYLPLPPAKKPGKTPTSKPSNPYGF